MIKNIFTDIHVKVGIQNKNEENESNKIHIRGELKSKQVNKNQVPETTDKKTYKHVVNLHFVTHCIYN